MSVTDHVVEAPVVVVAPSTAPRITDPVSPTTTKEEDLHSRAARGINLIWEGTQGAIALSVTGTVLFVSATLAMRPAPDNTSSFLFLTSLATLVIGFYFGRTNHARQGGVVGSNS